MNKRIIEKLANLSSYLDEKGLHKEADEIDKIIKNSWWPKSYFDKQKIKKLKREKVWKFYRNELYPMLDHAVKYDMPFEDLWEESRIKSLFDRFDIEYPEKAYEELKRSVHLWLEWKRKRDPERKWKAMLEEIKETKKSNGMFRAKGAWWDDIYDFLTEHGECSKSEMEELYEALGGKDHHEEALCGKDHHEEALGDKDDYEETLGGKDNHGEKRWTREIGCHTEPPDLIA